MKFVLFFTFLHLYISKVLGDTCAWNTCPTYDNTKINIHIVPHTHDDLGFVKRVDDYYSGIVSGYPSGLINVGVQYILNSAIQELLKNSSRRFTYCETGFLKRWWDDHTDADRQNLVKLVTAGQIELIGGGWVQPDEAASHYVDLIDQYTLGLGILNQTFGSCGHPRVLWQIDPFGHSKEHANLARMMGYESLFFSREHYKEHEMRMATKGLDLNWQVSTDSENNITTKVFFNHYHAPPDFCFDTTCENDPIVDNPNLESYNLDHKINEYMIYLANRTQHQRHNHVLNLMGQDFTYSNAEMWYVNIDKFIKHVNQRYPNISAFYSTPTCYIQAIKAENFTWPQKTDDFFPNAKGTFFDKATNNHAYWTGFFSSKPAFKGLTRKSSALLQLTRQLSTMSFLQPQIDQASNITKIEIFERSIALSQHHDGITGTSKEIVTQDYIYRQMKGWTAGEQVINNAVTAISNNIKNNSVPVPTQLICRNINESECLITKSTNNLAVTVYNSNGQNLNTLVRIPIYQTNTPSIIDNNGNSVSTQITDVFNNPGQINNSNISPKEAVFTVNVKPLGFKTYFISANGNTSQNASNSNGNSISNGLIQLDFDSNGLLSTFHDLLLKKDFSLKQEILYYHGCDNSSDQQPSGAYIFRPVGNATYGFSNINLTIINGPIVYEARQIISPWVSQVIRLIPNKTYVEFEWTVGPVPKDDKISKEVITRYTLNNFNSNSTFYTDANGRQLFSRNYAALYQYDNSEPIAANYFPVDSRILITDGSTTMGVLTDRSHGGSSLVDGQIEIMLHRRLFYDDYLGVGEPLNEPGRDGRGLVVRGRHWLILGNSNDVTNWHRSLAFELYHAPILMFAGINVSTNDYTNNFVTEFSALKQPLLPNINLLTLKQLDPNNILLRLEHFYQTGEDLGQSKPTTLDLNNLFANIKISQITEMSLAANNIMGVLSNSTVTLNPMEIRTYVLTIGASDNTTISTTTLATKSTSSIDPNIFSFFVSTCLYLLLN